MTTIEILMPRLSDSMEQGTIVRWLIPGGDPVRRGDELVEIETDKATIAQEAEGDGLLEIIAEAGMTVTVGTPIARLLPIGSGVLPDRARDGADAAVDRNGLATTAPPELPAQRSPGSSALITDGAGALGRAATRVTPLAQRIARAHGIATEQLTGSGPGGRVTRRDVLLAAGLSAPTAAPGRAETDAPPTPEPATQREPASTAKGERTTVAPTRSERLIARRMAESKATIPHFQVQMEVVMDGATALRSSLRAACGLSAAPSFNDFAIKAAALALRRHPRANASYVDGCYELYERVNIGFAVAAPDTLLVPVVQDADRKSLGSIAGQTRQMAERARNGEITPAELSGATFTISNLGMYGVTALSPVISPPQAAILGVGALRGTLARRNGNIVDETLMNLTLSCDHRILDGAGAALLLADIRSLLEEPLGLAL